MTRPRSVLQVLPRLVTGGVERGTVEVAAALTKAGWKAFVASAGGPMVKEIEAAGGVHISLPLASKNPFTMWQNVDRLAEVIRHHDIGLVHARSRAPAWSAYYAARQTNCPFVTTFHNAYGANSALKRAYNSIMARGARVIAISDFVAEHACRVYGVSDNILRVIPRGVDTDRFDPESVSSERTNALQQTWSIANDKPVIMLPGRLTRWKGQLILIEALAQLPTRDFQAIIVGSGDDDYRAELIQAIAQHQLQNVVKLVDECRDMPAAFKLADIVVSASTRPEGFGRVIVEAAAMGCPVIATEHGGARETVLDGETGWLVPPKDAVALATALKQVLAQTSEQCAVFAVKAISHVREHFSTALMTSRTLEVYEELL
jgi:glycosyltransferase involved in cell wall biosynthesis